MKRSEIQSAISYAKALIEKQGFHLPMFASWSMDQWRENKGELNTIIRTMRGWDVTDFGSGDFRRVGAVLFTIRNGLLGTDLGCPYAEKLIVLQDAQMLPLHFHFSKTEDIINRGGGILSIRVYNSLADGSVDERGDVRVFTDGVERIVPAGSWVDILPGNSMTIYPGLYHLFAAKEGCGDVLVGEVSAVNDDNIDNRFAVEMPRFTQIVEDEPIVVPLVNEYETVL